MGVSQGKKDQPGKWPTAFVCIVHKSDDVPFQGLCLSGHGLGKNSRQWKCFNLFGLWCPE